MEELGNEVTICGVDFYIVEPCMPDRINGGLSTELGTLFHFSVVILIRQVCTHRRLLKDEGWV